MCRFGSNLIVVWDEEDAATDVFLKAAYSVARALVIARKRDASRSQADFSAIDDALLDIKRNAESLDQITTSAQTVKNAGHKIEERVRIVRGALLSHVEQLQGHVEALRAPSGAGE